MADIMPPRVKERAIGDKTIGYADGEIGLKFTSGIDQTYSPAIERRLRAMGERPAVAQRLRSRIELKAAARMLQSGRKHSEVVINNVPCGSQPQEEYRGCHDTLPKFLPKGTTLTVHNASG